jgi:hypothetical protein
MPPETISKVVLRVVVNKLDALKVHCPRCLKTIERASLDAHVQQCAVLCPSGCRQKILPSSLGEHARVCTAVEVKCSAMDVGCSWAGARQALVGHKSKCKYVKQQTVLQCMIALEDKMQSLEDDKQAMLRRVTALEEANRALAEDNRELRARVTLLEGQENANH